MPTTPDLRYAPETLHEFCRRVFEYFDVPGPDAGVAADVLASADRRGIDSHGVARLETYTDLLANGRINPRPNVRIVRETPSTATMDGDNGLGLVVGPRANDLAAEKASSAGSGWVAVRHTNHFGIAGHYVLEAIRRDLIGMAMTNSTKIVAPLWGRDKMLGTNPIAIAFPGRDEPPIVIDMATSTVPLGKIEIALRTGERIPEGWAVDGHGRPTTDPRDVTDGGALLPLGSVREQGGHKGYCLASMVDLLTGVLSGAAWGPFTPPFALGLPMPERTVGAGVGHFFGAWRIDAFIAADEFKRQIDDWVRTFRSTPPAPGTEGPLIPGDPERAAEKERLQHGVPLLAPVVDSLRRISAQTGIPFD